MVGEDLDRGLGLRFLLDTNALYWALVDPDRLRDDSRGALLDPGNEVFVSAVSVYEWTFKAAIGKLGAAPDITTELSHAGFAHLPLSAGHAFSGGSLPLHHRDPFDRLLVAQAQHEGLTIVTSDEQLARYQVAVLPA